MRPLILSCASVAAIALAALAPTASAHEGAPFWSLPTTMSRIDGARVVIGGWSRRVQSESTLCSGEGPARRWSGERHWKHFVCTWTVFDSRGRVGRDVTFHVHTLTAKRFGIRDARFGSS